MRSNVDNEALSRYGVPAEAVSTPIKAAGGIEVGEVIEPGQAVPARGAAPRWRTARTRTPWSSIFIPTASGQRLPLTLLARFEETEGPSTIQRDWGERRIIVQTNVRGRDIGVVRRGGPGADRAAR